MMYSKPVPTSPGQIEVIVGSMYSGKTEELIRLLRQAKYARQSIQVFKPKVDSRYSVDHIASHDRSLLSSISVDRAEDIYRHLRPGTQVIGIDEGQFFDDELVEVASELADRGLRVIIAGLDMNWKGEPFHPMPALMAVAETVKKLRAVCVQCGVPASRTQRLVKDNAAVLVGAESIYEARCRHCADPEAPYHDTAGAAEGEETAMPTDLRVSVTVLPSNSATATT